MSQELTRILQKSLAEGTDLDALEVIDLIPLPRSSDRMVRFRNLQEVLDEFDATDEAVQSYVIQVRKKGATPTPQEENRNPTPRGASLAKTEEIYRNDGTLNADFLLENAALLFSAGEYAAARQIYATLRRSGSQTSQAMLGLANCLEAEGQLNEALKAYEESILYHPQLLTYQRLAGLLIRLKRDQQAAETLERALLIKTATTQERFEMFNTAGNCWLRCQDYKNAEKNYRHAFALRPGSDGVSANLGSLQLQTQQFAQAIVTFQETLRLNPANSQALTGIATAELALGRKPEAFAAFVRALQVDLRQPKAIIQLVKLAYELKQYAEAARFLSDYIEVSPFNANLLYSLAGLEFHLANHARCAQIVRQILEIEPNHVEALKLRERIEGIHRSQG